MSTEKSTVSAAFRSLACRLSLLGAAAIVGVFLNTAVAEGRNIAMTDKGIAVATRGEDGGLTIFDATRGGKIDHIILMKGGRFFDDVTIDPVGNQQFVFVLSVASERVCSLELMNEGGYFFSPIGCTSKKVSVSPYTGISALNGTLVVSGGTGGTSVFKYNQQDGRIEDSGKDIVSNLTADVLPGVAMITSTLAALSAIFTSSQYGTIIASIEDATVTGIREFIINRSIGMNYALAPTNFPLENSIYFEANGSTYMYTANGPITLQDPTKDGDSIVVEVAPKGFQAMTVAVNSGKRRAVFGGLLNGDSVLILLDITAPLAPTFVNSTVVERGGEISSDFNFIPPRISSVATSGNYIVYTFGEAEIGLIKIEGGMEPAMVENSTLVEATKDASQSSPNLPHSLRGRRKL